jgi:hypothetical protein
MTTTNRANVVAIAVLRTVADHLASKWVDDMSELRALVADMLADEFDDIRRTTLNEIRLNDEEPPALPAGMNLHTEGVPHGETI